MPRESPTKLGVQFHQTGLSRQFLFGNMRLPPPVRFKAPYRGIFAACYILLSVQLLPCYAYLMTVIAMTERSEIEIGSRVYLANCIAGEPGCVIGFERGRAVVTWPDMPEQRDTRHAPETLVVDEAFRVAQFHLDFGEVAA